MIQKSKLKRVVIAGAGLIGLEMAEAFRELGLHITIIEKQNHVLPIFSSDMAEIIEKHLLDQGVDLILGDGISEFRGRQQVEKAYC